MEPDGYQFPQIAISSGERQVWPDGNAFGVVLSGERQIWSDGGAAANTPLGRGLLSRGWHCPQGVLPFVHLRSGPSTVSCVPLRGTCLRRTPTQYIRSAHQCAGRAVYFAAAKYGKAGRPPGVATLVAVRGLVPPK